MYSHSFCVFSKFIYFLLKNNCLVCNLLQDVLFFFQFLCFAQLLILSTFSSPTAKLCPNFNPLLVICYIFFSIFSYSHKYMDVQMTLNIKYYCFIYKIRILLYTVFCILLMEIHASVTIKSQKYLPAIWQTVFLFLRIHNIPLHRNFPSCSIISKLM